MGRIGRFLDDTVSESQAGFRSGRGTMDNIFVLRQLLQRRHEFGKDTAIAYLDFSAAFDSVDRESLWQILTACGIPPFYVNMIKKMYAESVSIVRAHGETGQPFKVSTGVRQGDVGSPILFIHAVDWVIRHATNSQDGVVVGENFKVRSLEYADDVALVADSIEQLQDLIDRFGLRSKMLGLSLNEKKCKFTSSFDPATLPTVNGVPLEKVKQFCYLGSTIEESGDPSSEVRIRIGKATSVFRSLRWCLWRRRQIPIGIKLRLFDSMVMSIPYYGLELLSLNVVYTQQIAAFEQYCLRAILGVGWRQHVTNEEVLQRCGRKGSMAMRLLQHRCRWLGHIGRMSQSRFQFQSFFSEPPSHWHRRPGDNEPRGKPASNLTPRRQQGGYMRMHGLPWKDTILNLTQDRQVWKEFTSKCCHHRNAAQALNTGRRVQI